MPNFNKVLLIGNLTGDPEFKQTPKGHSVTTFGLATNRRIPKPSGTTDQRTCFVDIVVWDSLAKACAEFLKKGKCVFIEGWLEYHSWEKDGKSSSNLSVHAQRVEFLSPPESAPQPLPAQQSA